MVNRAMTHETRRLLRGTHLRPLWEGQHLEAELKMLHLGGRNKRLPGIVNTGDLREIYAPKLTGFGV